MSGFFILKIYNMTTYGEIEYMVLDKLKLNELAKIAVVLVINNMCYALANFIFAYAKHFLRLRLCKRLGIEPTERNIAVMESMEYQSV